MNTPPSKDEIPLRPGGAGGRILGQYLLLDKLGQGGMGAVHKALHLRLKRLVAVKVLPADRMHDAQAVARFAREMEVIGKLDHPNVIRATDAGEVDGLHFLVMEYAQGTDVAKLARKRGPLPVADACEIARQAALGLQGIHEHGLVHRDIKPSNLLLTPTGQVKILDLGLARLYGEPAPGDELTYAGQVMGTADYMAPEQGRDSHEVDIRADIYSLGCTLYKLLAGRAPFSGPEYDSFSKKVMGHAEGTVPALSGWRSDVPPTLGPALDRMLAKDPADRFGTPGEVALALEPFTAGAALAQAAAAVLADEPASPGEVAAGNPADALVETGHPKPETRPQEGSARSPSAEAAFRARRRRFLRYGLAAGIGLLGPTGLLLLARKQPAEVRVGSQLAPGEPAEEELAPGQWHNLLQRAPTPLAWPKNAMPPVFDAKRQELLAMCPGVGLLRLHQTREPGYKIQVCLQQNQWVGGVGIFFGYHPDRHEGDPCIKYQTIRLVRTGRKDPAQAFMLYRAKALIVTLPNGQRDHPTAEVAAHPVPRPNGPEEILEIEVTSNGQLTTARWGAILLSELVSPKANSSFTPDDYRGDFGMLCANSTGVFRAARLMLTEKEDP
jgi:hypothetical protein